VEIEEEKQSESGRYRQSIDKTMRRLGEDESWGGGVKIKRDREEQRWRELGGLL